MKCAGIRSANGFTLVEVIVGIVLMTLGILMMAGLAASVAQSNRGATNRTRADQLVHEIVEQFRSFDYDDVVSGTDTVSMGEVRIARTWTVTEDEPREGLKQVEVLGTWSERGANWQTRTMTLVGKY